MVSNPLIIAERHHNMRFRHIGTVPEDEPPRYDDICFEPKESNTIVYKLRKIITKSQITSNYLIEYLSRNHNDRTLEPADEDEYARKNQIRRIKKNLKIMHKILNEQECHYYKNIENLIKARDTNERNDIEGTLGCLKRVIEFQKRKINVEEMDLKNLYKVMLTSRNNQNRDVDTDYYLDFDIMSSDDDTQYVSADDMTNVMSNTIDDTEDIPRNIFMLPCSFFTR